MMSATRFLIAGSIGVAMAAGPVAQTSPDVPLSGPAGQVLGGGPTVEGSHRTTVTNGADMLVAGFRG